MRSFLGVAAASLLVLASASEASAQTSPFRTRPGGSVAPQRSGPGPGVQNPGGGGRGPGGPGPGQGAGGPGRGPGPGGPGGRGGYRGGYRGGGGSVIIAPGYYDPFWPYPYGYYPYGYGYGYPYGYIPPPVVRERVTAPPDYIPPDDLGPPPEQYWYYCDAPQGYYPYVRDCTHEWQPVPATPPGAVAGPPPDGEDGPPPDGEGDAN